MARRSFQSPARQRGVALLTALLVVTLATIAAVSMATRQHMDIRRTTNVFTHDQAYQLSLGAEAYALRLLGEVHQNADVDLPWEGCLSPPIPVVLEDADLTVWLEDMHCRFNINDLATEDESVHEQFVQLLDAISVEAQGVTLDSDGLTRSLIDWLNPETDDPTYRGLEPPYLSGNQPMLSATELRLLRGVTDEVWHKVAPYLTALPGTEAGMNLAEAPDVLREVFGEADADTDDDEETAFTSRYYRLAVRTELVDRRFLLCSLLDVAEQRVILREQIPCGP
ncbi:MULTISPECIES: type II secretion system minor pseudopilin GspK [unclassified Ectothiorhodospira]|uniref:type II secretion system minor pseudopilin GspK n=1 Tax=unclassified Ectothiorhodospira TaxID=2684909 RepID=UPI001EE8B503|nr:MULTISPECIES: type II secretion system minor pseudopilin GspK [unclassified Ectothiorhodospira]MCG5517181.1 type II secretion system minor pseudopilin GspK [Ectothiorhodospira sp. 9100]MCG5520086.1 type II secretion system minor pseudopilin GspK [Ectothiorhodospira sp. 9905]